MSAKAQSDTKMIHHSPLDACAETGVWFPMGIEVIFQRINGLPTDNPCVLIWERKQNLRKFSDIPN